MESEKAFKRRLAAAQNMAVRQRNYKRARERALTRLANAHKGEYLDYLAQEKEKDIKEGKRWNNLTDNLPDSGFTITGYYHNQGGGDSPTDTQDKGNQV